MSELLTIAMAAELTEPEVDGVLRLVADAEAVDQVRALNEAALLRLRRPHPDHPTSSGQRGRESGGLRPAGIRERVERRPAPGCSGTSAAGHRHPAAAAADHGVESPVARVGNG